MIPLDYRRRWTISHSRWTCTKWRWNIIRRSCSTSRWKQGSTKRYDLMSWFVWYMYTTCIVVVRNDIPKTRDLANSLWYVIEKEVIKESSKGVNGLVFIYKWGPCMEVILNLIGRPLLLCWLQNEQALDALRRERECLLVELRRMESERSYQQELPTVRQHCMCRFTQY